MEIYMGNAPEDEAEDGPYGCSVQNRFVIIYQSFFDRIVPYLACRWLSFIFLLAVYVLRVVQTQGFFVVSYALGVFLLSQFLGFLTPQVQPSLSRGKFLCRDEINLCLDADPLLPTNSDGEFRPFMRLLSEIKFWKNCTFAVMLSIICTFFPILDLPVFWPILLLYFIILCYVTLQRQIAVSLPFDFTVPFLFIFTKQYSEHMIKYRYMPFTYGKPRPLSKGGSDTQPLTVEIISLIGFQTTTALRCSLDKYAAIASGFIFRSKPGRAYPGFQFVAS
ncbi:unnamed protein product [Dibothriocephalus latus]|uniref:Protein RER1 n=1 Tax=Dibothriocephalus latus TaxID=60516 RepID=A0A3P7LT65_DIBLA|nr:unnamed protein product [Dibothriocephalus latus]